MAVTPLILVTNPAAPSHNTGDGHPESSDRLHAIMDVLRGAEFADIPRFEAPSATTADLRLAHSDDHIMAVENAIPDDALAIIGGDTVLSPDSLAAALRGVGGGLLAVQQVMQGQARRAFVLTRPPGHHAGRNRISGFCLFNTIAIAALAARAKYGAARVAIVDFDVHHGDGTQDIVWNQQDVFFSSLHQEGIYPHTGLLTDRGAFNTILNIPLPAGTSGTDFLARITNDIIPRLDLFRPDIILVSAGFDAHVMDPLGGLALTTEDYRDIMRLLCDTADRLCDGRLVAVLEGGYNLSALAESVKVCVAVMADIRSAQ